MQRNSGRLHPLLEAKGATGIDEVINVGPYKTLVVSYDTDGGGDAAATVKFVGSIANDKPDFTAAQSVTNSYDFIEVVDLEDGAAIDGDAGIVVATADDHRLLEVNVNGLEWFTARVTARTEGEITVSARVFSNQ